MKTAKELLIESGRPYIPTPPELLNLYREFEDLVGVGGELTKLQKKMDDIAGKLADRLHRWGRDKESKDLTKVLSANEKATENLKTIAHKFKVAVLNGNEAMQAAMKEK